MAYIYDESSTYKVTLIIIATLMLMMSLPTFFINMCIIISILRNSELHTPSFTVIVNLAISDCLAGCSAYVFYAVVCIRFASGYDACPVAYIGTPWSYMLAITSINTITLQTIERYIAIFFPYWYHEKITVKRTLLANLLTWVLSITIVTYWLATKDNQAYRGVVGSLVVILLAVTATCYCRIFREVRRIELEMMTHQTASFEERRKIQSESKVAKATVIILLAVVACYSPMLFLDLSFALVGEQTTSFAIALYWAWLLALVNSFVNPMIACRQLTVLRRPVVRILLSVFPCCKGHDVTPRESPTSITVTVLRASKQDVSFGKTDVQHPQVNQTTEDL